MLASDTDAVPAPAKKDSVRTLILEDDPVSRLLLSRVLEQRGHDVIANGTIAEAEQAHRAQAFDLMVVDLLLPDGDGLSFTKRVRANQAGEDVYILVVTGRDSSADLDEVLEAGADDYLAKPVDPRLLATRVAIAERSVRHLLVRRRISKALREREALLGAIFDAAPDGILAFDDKSRILSANPAASEMLSIPEADLIGAPIDNVLAWRGEGESPWKPPGPKQQVLRLSSVEGRPRDGRNFPAEISMSIVPLENESVYTLILRDVSERHALEAKLRLTDRMSTVGTLAAGIAHEINNPLTYVIANLEHARDVLLEEPSPAALADLVDAIREGREGAERVRHIVRDLRTFSRPDEEASGPVDVVAVLESTLGMVQNEIRPRAHVVRRFEERRPVIANAARLGQVFLNVLVNAAHAIPEGDVDGNTITVTTRGTDDGQIVIEISDTGRGISPEILDRVFDPFFTTKPVGEGTGLGLFICHTIVKGLGGAIDVTSTEGRGTSLQIRLTAAEPFEAIPTTPAGDEEPPQPSGRILVVDDERFVGRAVQRALREHDVVIETDSRVAVERILNEPFDLIVCDLLMPDVSGMDIWEIIDRTRPDLRSRIVFMTGGAFTPRAQAFLSSVNIACLEKPFVPAQLRKLVRRSLDLAAASAMQGVTS